MKELLERYRMRVEAARMQGEMPQYVEDVGDLVALVDSLLVQAKAYEAGHQEVANQFARLKAEAFLPDTADRKSADTLLMLAGAEIVIKAANIAIKQEMARAA